MATTKVIMTAGNKTQEFDIDHAQRILNLQKARKLKNGWQLKPDSGFELKDDGTITSSNTGAAEKAEKRSGNTGGK